MTDRSPRVVRELPADGEVPRVQHPEWSEAFPWLVQGTTTRGEPSPWDFALFGAGATARVLGRWEALGRATGIERLIHGRQVHADAVRLHEEGPPGLQVSPPCDGHVTARSGVLLTVGLADCVAVSLVEPRRRVIALLHAGWRGAAAGILDRGLEVLRDRLAVAAGDLHAHLGPSICGACYEVGPEVHEALGLPRPERPAPVDLRAVLARRAVEAGITPERITVSAHCTLCGGSPFFSHRGGSAERQVAFLGVLD